MKFFSSCDRFWALIAASGSGERLGQTTPKQLLPLLGRAMISYSVDIFAQDSRIAGLMIATDSDEEVRAALGSVSFNICAGGASRSESIYKGLCAIEELDSSNPVVLIHDASRPCLHRDDVDNCLRHLIDDPDQPLILASKATDSIKLSSGSSVGRSLDRNQIWQAQTPQCARLNILRQAMDQHNGEVMTTDDSWFLEQAGYRVRLLEARHANIKVTWPQDMIIASALLDSMIDKPLHSPE